MTPQNPASTGRQFGYARVSTQDQNAQLQIDALVKAGIDPECIYVDHASGKLAHREHLDRMLADLQSGDTVTVWRLDRLGRSLKNLIAIVGDLDEHEVGFRSLSDSIDTTTANGKLVFHLLAALAEFERDLIRERTNAGLEAARARGRVGGRPKVMSDDRIAVARSLLADGRTVDQVAATLGVSRRSVYRYLGDGDRVSA